MFIDKYYNKNMTGKTVIKKKIIWFVSVIFLFDVTLHHY